MTELIVLSFLGLFYADNHEFIKQVKDDMAKDTLGNTLAILNGMKKSLLHSLLGILTVRILTFIGN